mgnify:CR=1 FL=1
MSLLGTKEIMEIIPCSFNFLVFINANSNQPIAKVSSAATATFPFTVAVYNEPFFAGHFPQEPVMPGVLIVEALAQAGA